MPPARDSKVDVLVPLRCDLGEGCVWLPDSRALVWIDITGRALYRWSHGDDKVTALSLPEPPGSLAPRRQGGLILAALGGFFAVGEAAWPEIEGARRAVAFGSGDADGTVSGEVAPSIARGAPSPAEPVPVLPLLSPVEAGRPTNRMNDGRCDRLGRFWAGSMSMRSEPEAGSLFRLGTDRHVERMLTGVSISNGLCFRADDRAMYYIDTPTQRVDVFDFDLSEGLIRDRRPLIEIPRETGAPDGMTIDAEGCLWVALWGGSGVHRYRPDGKLDRIIEVPARRVTSCTFGGPALDELYITTASGGPADGELRENPHAGALFVCRPGVHGLPPDPYGG